MAVKTKTGKKKMAKVPIEKKPPKLNAKGLARAFVDLTEEEYMKFWAMNDNNKYTSGESFKPFFTMVVKALIRHDDCSGIVHKIIRGK